VIVKDEGADAEGSDKHAKAQALADTVATLITLCVDDREHHHRHERSGHSYGKHFLNAFGGAVYRGKAEILGFHGWQSERHRAKDKVGDEASEGSHKDTLVVHACAFCTASKQSSLSKDSSVPWLMNPHMVSSGIPVCVRTTLVWLPSSMKSTVT